MPEPAEGHGARGGWRSKRQAALHAVGLPLAAAIFVFDLVMPHGVAAAVPYALLVLLSLRVPGPGLTWFVALSVTVLTLLGAVLPALPEEDLWQLAINRLLALLAIWTTAALCLVHKHDLARLEERRHATSRAQELANLGELAAGVAHELGTPLAALQGRIELLEQRLASPPVDPDQLHKSLRNLADLGDRMTRIVRTVRSLARDAAGDPFEQVAVAQLLRDALVLGEERLRRSGATVRAAPVPETLRIDCRPAQVTQVLLNLIGNAADAVRALPERWVQIELRETAERVAIVVTDSGAGVPEEIRARIMAPFFTTKPPGEGTGLGLSISRALVEAHGGTLALEPGSPHTRFVVTLPRRQPPAR